MSTEPEGLAITDEELIFTESNHSRHYPIFKDKDDAEYIFIRFTPQKIGTLAPGVTRVTRQKRASK